MPRHPYWPGEIQVEKIEMFAVIREASGKVLGGSGASGGILGGGFAPRAAPPHGGMYTYHAIFGFWGLCFRHSGDDLSSFSSFGSPQI